MRQSLQQGTCIHCSKGRRIRTLTHKVIYTGGKRTDAHASSNTYLAISNRAVRISTVALDDDGEATNNACGGGGGADAGDTSGRMSAWVGVMGGGGGGAAAAAPAVAAVAGNMATGVA